MIKIDGSYGEGGGQIVRTALALSLVTGKALQIQNIRAHREKPGLLRQHLTAVNAAAEIGHAKVFGNTLGSRELSFVPQTIQPGTYHFAIGTAGSCTLVFQTILPALMLADSPSKLTFEGGTHNPFAPPYEFLAKSFLPLVYQMGPQVKTTLERHGFYPAGGGRFTVDVQTVTQLRPLNLESRGMIRSCGARALLSQLPKNIGTRELNVVQEKLGWAHSTLQVEEIDNGSGPGNVLLLTVESESLTEVFTGFGKQGLRAENVAARAVDIVRGYLDAGVPIGPYLADQLLIPMALAGGGMFRTVTPTEHTRTNAEIIKRFLDVHITFTEQSENCWNAHIG